MGSVSKGGESASYTYDGSLLLTDTRAGTISESISYGYNSDLQVESITYAGQIDSFLYDNDGLLTDAGPYTIARDVANGLPESVFDGTVTQGRDFSSYGEVNGVDYTVDSVAVYSWAVSRDNAGRITYKEEDIGGTTVTWDYTYDLMGRLETVYQDSIMAEAYSYDGQGNRLEETNVLRGVSRTYTNDDEDKIVWAGLDFYQYDVDGFLTSRSIAAGVNSGITTFDYSSRGELLSVSLPAAAGTITYTHDPMGRRISKSINSTVVEKYLWQDATTLLAVYDGSDNLLQRFEYADGRMPVAMTSGAALYYLAYNQVGSLRVVTDAAGTVVRRLDYDSFGNILSDSNPSLAVPFGFAGGLHDRDTGLVRFGARDYDPAVGRWTAKDPIDFAGGDLNLGSYVGQDPVNWVDPEGQVRWNQFFSSAFGLAGNALGVFVGGTLLAAPELTMATKIVGGAVLGKSVIGWGLNWHNLVQSLAQPCDNFDAPSSAARGIASIVAPGSQDAQRLADVADLSLDLLAGRAKIYPYRRLGISKYQATYDPSKYLFTNQNVVTMFQGSQVVEVGINNVFP